MPDQTLSVSSIPRYGRTVAGSSTCPDGLLRSDVAVITGVVAQDTAAAT